MRRSLQQAARAFFAFWLLGAAPHSYAAEAGYFRVTGVAPGDVLNVRLEPDAKSEAIGELAPGAEPVDVREVVTDGQAEWGRVLAADADGWVSMKFLEPVEIKAVGGTLVPDGLSCVGTEPFWDATINAGAGIAFSQTDEAKQVYKFQSVIAATGRNSRFSVIGGDAAARITIVLANGELCYDGMSDRTYGWRADVLREKPGAKEYPQAFEGCCHLPVRK